MRTRIILLTLTIVAVIAVILVLYSKWPGITNFKNGSLISFETGIINTDKNKNGLNQDFPKVSVFSEKLKVPWSIAFLPNGDLLVTEREGRVRLVAKEGQLTSEPVAKIAVKQTAEGGLHGITLHPNFAKNKFVYLYYTYSENGGNTLNKVSRFTFENNKLVSEQVIVDKIPGAANHDGGRVKFGPDGFLYITTGDAQNPSQAQDTNSLAGKILRVTDTGEPAPGNPFDKRTYSYGHRNPQGITWDKNGQLWETEHGPSGVETGNDELNKIELGKNYGWPTIRGMEMREGMVTPILESGRGNTWAPADIAYLDGFLYFVGLRGEALYRVTIEKPTKLDTFFKKEYGRLREIAAGSDNMLYVTTSNRDGRGKPKDGDDKILRINPNRL